MNEYIKKGVDIYDDIEEATGNTVPELAKKKWISLTWLKERIEKRKQIVVGGELLDDLDWVLSLLKEETMDEYSTVVKHSSEILAIIEGGLDGNQKKVRAYTELLVSKLPDGDHMKTAIKRRLDGSYKNDPVLEAKKT